MNERVWNGSIWALAVLALGAAAGVAAFLSLTPSAPVTTEISPVWTEIKWSFPIDQWGTGKVFRCKASDCGNAVDIFLRAKIGFCNCTTGVADDQELERLADLDLLGERPAALAPGRSIEVRWMKGRSRPYSFLGSAVDLAIAFNDRCDAIVATVVADPDRPAALESIALPFLNSDTVIRWAETTLGL
jgi:hypothetical protein